MTDTPNSGILSSGEVLNNTYVVGDLIASGGTGEVYRATNRVSGREIAIKILKKEFAQDEQFTNLMKREASVLHEVVDPAVVRYYDLLESDLHGGFLFIVMEFIEGQSLADEMKSKGPVDEATLLQVAERVLKGLMAAHAKNAFHRDLSPDNILLRDGDPEQSTLIDFGIAKDVNEGAKTVVGGGFAGKYQYASPEQMEGRTDARSDLYSLGMTLMGAFRGQSPNAGSSLMEIVSAKAVKPDISDMTGPLGDLVSRLVEPDPNNRLQSAKEALVYLKTAGEPDPVLALTGETEQTVVIARPKAPDTSHLPTTGAESSVSLKTAMNDAPKKSRTGLYALLFLLLAGAGGGAYFSGMLDPAAPDKPNQVAVNTPEPEPEPTPEPEPEPQPEPTGETPTIGDTPQTPSTQTEDDNGTLVTPGTDEGTQTVTAPSTEPQPEPDTEPKPSEAAEAPLPMADPFVLTIKRASREDPLQLTGNLPSNEAIPAFTARLEEALGDFAVTADVTAALGEPFTGWSQNVLNVALLFAELDAWSVAGNGSDVIVTATANNDAEKFALLNGARDLVKGTGLNIVDRIHVDVPPLELAQLTADLQSKSTCGPLGLTGGTDGKVGETDTLTITGPISSATDLARIQGHLIEKAPGRTIRADTKIINPGVCAVLNILPPQNAPELTIEYGYGLKSGAVEGDIYRLGENPVIDVHVPKDRKGYMTVAFVDLANQVFHLLPHQARKENDLSEIGTVDGDTRKVRVAFPVAEASIEQLGFKVVEPLGINILLAVVTDEPLFDQIRPRAESNTAFMEALSNRLAGLPDQGGLVTYRFLMTLE